MLGGRRGCSESFLPAAQRTPLWAVHVGPGAGGGWGAGAHARVAPAGPALVWCMGFGTGWVLWVSPIPGAGKSTRDLGRRALLQSKSVCPGCWARQWDRARRQTPAKPCSPRDFLATGRRGIPARNLIPKSPSHQPGALVARGSWDGLREGGEWPCGADVMSLEAVAGGALDGGQELPIRGGLLRGQAAGTGLRKGCWARRAQGPHHSLQPSLCPPAHRPSVHATHFGSFPEDMYHSCTCVPDSGRDMEPS